MVNVTDPQIKSSYEEVRSDSNDTNWALYGYQDKNTIVFEAKGSGGLEELFKHFDDNKCQYAFVRVISGDNESKRSKFIFLSWCGENASPLQRGNMSVHKGSLKTVVSKFQVEQHYTSQDELDVAKLMEKVKKASGADYSGNTN